MHEFIKKLKKLSADLDKTKKFFFDEMSKANSSIHIYTHLDADGLASGAILGKALYRENIPFQISILRQLEREEISKIKKTIREHDNLVIFSDFGSGQYLELVEKLKNTDHLSPFIIFSFSLNSVNSIKKNLSYRS